MQALRKTVIEQLSHSENTALIATNLNGTGNWTLDGNTIKTTVMSNFALMQLAKQSGEIAKKVSAVFGEQIQFKVALAQSAQENSSENTPYEVQLLCSLFRGQIVAKGERTESAKPEESEKNNGEESSEDSPENNNFNNETTEEDDDESI